MSTELIERLRRIAKRDTCNSPDSINEAADEIERLRTELAAAQAREKVLREALHKVAWHRAPSERANVLVEKLERFALDALDLHADTSTLDTLLKQAREEMRERCVATHDDDGVLAPVGNSAYGEAYQDGWAAGTSAYRDAIRALEVKP